mgnify:CR=1 FL=1
MTLKAKCEAMVKAGYVAREERYGWAIYRGAECVTYAHATETNAWAEAAKRAA